MISEEKKALAVALLQEKSKELGRLPKKDDFDEVTRSRIKAFLGPWPRALEAAGLKVVKAGRKKQKEEKEEYGNDGKGKKIMRGIWKGFFNRARGVLLAAVMLINLLPATALAQESNLVYMSISYDGQFVEGVNGTPIAYAGVPITALEAIDLEEYGLSDYLYDADVDGDYDVTALHLYIYTHEVLLGLSWDDVRVSGGQGSIFFEEGLFGFPDCNLNYYLNGEYPAIDGWGLTADQLSLSSGDFYDVAGYTSWSFYNDSLCGFHYFTDEEGNIVHEFEVEANETLNVGLVRTGALFGSEAQTAAESGYQVFYGRNFGDAETSVVTDGEGNLSLSFDVAGDWYLWCDGSYGAENPLDIVSAPAYAKVNVTAGEVSVPARQPQDVSGVLNATMSQLAATVTEPAFGTNAGEWTVLSLARGEYFSGSDAYFTGYYERIVSTVNEKASSVDLNGALHKSKSTDNSRLIVALSAIGKNATSVGNWNLVAPYEDFNWIKKQGINGVIWALIALDTNNYATMDTTIRQQCVDLILEKQLEDGGWALSGSSADPDITSMTLQALYNYREQEAVATAAEEAFACLSAIQNEDGGYSSFGDPNSESCAQVIVACATWGINPDTDTRFVKNNKSVLDALLAHYVESASAFKHVAGGTVNAMATDQACYALVAYNRLINQKNSLYDMSDVTFEEVALPTEMAAYLGVPEQIENIEGETFNVLVSMNSWDNEGGYKLIDFILMLPDGLNVTKVEPGSRLSGGTVSYHLEQSTGKLRVVYFDANENKSLTVSGSSFPAEFFRIELEVVEELEEEELQIALTGMSVKRSSDAYDEDNMQVVNIDAAQRVIEVVEGMAFSALCLYQGDGVDLIPTDKKAVAIAVTQAKEQQKILFDDGTTQIEFLYNEAISAQTGVVGYVALVDASLDMEVFTDKKNYAVSEEETSELVFGDANGDGVINAQDALATVDAWLRKTNAPQGAQILTMNVNGDSRINTFDALGIVEAFVNGSEYDVVTKAAVLKVEEEE